MSISDGFNFSGNTSLNIQNFHSAMTGTNGVTVNITGGLPAEANNDIGGNDCTLGGCEM